MESACKLDQVKRSVAFIVFVCVAVLFVLSVNFIGKNECPKNAYREWHRAGVLTRMTSCALLAYLLYFDTLVCNNNYTKITAVIC